MKPKLLLCILFGVFGALVNGQEHTCKWYGTCYNLGANSFTCPYDGPPLPLNGTDDIYEILERRCPNIFYDDEGNRIPYDEILTCCSADQVIEMDESFQMVDGLLARCPSCLRNFLNNICEFSCGIDQSRYMEVYTTISPDGIEYINELDLRVNKEYMDAVFDSCSDVIMTQMGAPAVNLMCAAAPVCDSQSWFDAQGDINSPYVHIQMNYLAVNTTEDALILPTLSCSEAPEGSFPCACSDCFASCPTDYEPEVAPPICTVLSINCISFSIGLTAFVVLIAVFAILTIIDYMKWEKNPMQTKPKSKENEPRLLTKWFVSFFSCLSGVCAGNPVLILMLSSWFCFGAMYGINYLELTSDPIELWSSPTSQVRQELEFYEERFDPFYRTTQVFFTVEREPFVADNNVTYGPAFYLDALQEFISLENRIININRLDNGIVLEEVCYDPFRSSDMDPDLSLCTVMSVSNYVGTDPEAIVEGSYLNTIQGCLNNYLDTFCLASWGGGSDPKLAVGGFSNGNPQLATTLVLTLPLKHLKRDQDFMEKALEWELKFIELMKHYEANEKPDYVDIAFGAERSVEDELKDVTQGEAVTLVISYLLMFLYVTINLGKVIKLKTLLEDSQIMVALASIVIVLLSIGCSLGLLGYFGLPLSLLVINVIPFFILSVGVDNIFIMVNTLYLERQAFKKSPEYAITTFEERRKIIFRRMMTKVGPSIMVTSFSQMFCFAIGSLSSSPVVYAFAICATLTLAILFLFQITTSVAILSIDYQRSEGKRLDLFCCIQKKIIDDREPLKDRDEYKGLVQKLIEIYATVLFKWQVKIIVVIVFIAFLSFSIIVSPHVEVGLDQQMALHYQSYTRKYLIAVGNLLEQGAPVYFVVTAGLNLSNFDHQNLLCGGTLCNQDSLYTQVFLSSLHSEDTYISTSSNSWLDDYFDWSTLRGTCCKYNSEDNSFCQTMNTSTVCSYCDINLDDFGLRPAAEDFTRYVPWFLRDIPTDLCAKGGAGSYAGAVNYILDDFGHAIVQESSFMAYHTPLKTSKDYYEAYGYARKIADNITAVIHRETGLTDVKVFPSSIFYVYYDFYLTMWGDSATVLAYSLLAIFFINIVMTSFDLVATLATMINVIMIITDMFGIMYLWSVPLNPVSLINLVVAISIGVEFCSHIVQAYATSDKPIRKRAKDALIQMGANVINGITLTNIPIVVLAFSYTELMETLFFRMFFGLVILGVLHGLVFLPVLLSFMSNVFSYKSNRS